MEGKEIGYLGVGVFIFVVMMCFGIVLTSTLSYTARADTTTTLSGITVLTNGTLTDFGTSYPYVQTVTDCVNATTANPLAEANYTVITGNNAGSGGFVLLDSGATYVGQDVNCTVSYLKTTTASTAITALIVLFGTLAGLSIIVVLFIVIKPVLKLN